MPMDERQKGLHKLWLQRLSKVTRLCRNCWVTWTLTNAQKMRWQAPSQGYKAEFCSTICFSEFQQKIAYAAKRGGDPDAWGPRWRDRRTGRYYGGRRLR